MSIQDIPVVTMGPGSQPTEPDGMQLDYIAMPKDMATFSAPDIPQPDAVRHLAGARVAMNWLREALAQAKPGAEPKLADLTGLDEESRDLVNQILGEGEVSIKYTGTVRARIQEAVLAGVWRVFYLDDEDRVVKDLIEVSDVPLLVRMPRPDGPSLSTLKDRIPPEGAMNAMSILTELEQHCETHDSAMAPYAINLTLLPLSPEDLAFLDETLGRGPVDILSRGYGDCQVISTIVSNLWWVRYHNSMGTQILNTLEIVDVPAVACAAPEDLADSASRLASIVEPYWPDDD